MGISQHSHNPACGTDPRHEEDKVALVVQSDASVDPCCQSRALGNGAGGGHSHGQWWSICRTQRLQTEQWCVRWCQLSPYLDVHRSQLGHLERRPRHARAASSCPLRLHSLPLGIPLWRYGARYATASPRLTSGFGPSHFLHRRTRMPRCGPAGIGGGPRRSHPHRSGVNTLPRGG